MNKTYKKAKMDQIDIRYLYFLKYPKILKKFKIFWMGQKLQSCVLTLSQPEVILHL